MAWFRIERMGSERTDGEESGQDTCQRGRDEENYGRRELRRSE